jgi:hypothetical protein
MWQFLSQMIELNEHQVSVLFQKQTSLLFSESFTRILTQHSHYCTDTSTTECKQTEEEHLVLPTEILSM